MRDAVDSMFMGVKDGKVAMEKKVILMDEVDGCSSGDRGGI